MGSPSARLNTPEHLRAFVDAGLEFLYAPGRVPPLAQAQAANGPTARQAKAAPRPSPPPSPRPAAPGNPVSQRRPVPARPMPAMQGQQQPVRPGGGSFTEPWASFLSRVAPAPRIVWTYMELGLDLAGQSDPRRAGVLRNLIAHLRWPKGTTAFWPVAALANGALAPDAAMFWKGWNLWRTPDIACFGLEALHVIQPQADAACATCFLEHTTIHVLPSLTELMAMLPHEQQMAVDVLATLPMGSA